MRKLFLVSFTFITGETEYKEQRLMAVEADADASENDYLERGHNKFHEWFKENYPQSNIMSAIIHKTI